MARPSSADLDGEFTPRLFFKYYYPILSSLAASTVHQVINGIVLGHFVGPEALAAVSMSTPVHLFFISITLSASVGGGILISRLRGAGDMEKPRQIFQWLTTWWMVVGISIYVIFPYAHNSVIGFLVDSNSSVSLRAYTSDYLYWAWLWMPFFALRLIWSTCITHENNPNISLNSSLIAVLLNILFDLFFVGGLSMGTTGASIATGLSTLSAVGVLIWHLKFRATHFELRGFKPKFTIHELPVIAKLGLPTLISELSFSLGLFALTQAIQKYGPNPTAAFGMINHCSFLFLRLMTAAMLSFKPIASHYIGAGRVDRVLLALRFSVVFTLFVGFAVLTLAYVFRHQIVQLYLNTNDPGLLHVAGEGLVMFFLLFVAAGPNFLVASYFQCLGNPIASVSIAVVKNFALVIILLELTGDNGPNGVWLSRSLAEILTLVLVGAVSILKICPILKRATPAN